MDDDFPTNPPAAICSHHFSKTSYRANEKNTLKKSALPINFKLEFGDEDEPEPKVYNKKTRAKRSSPLKTENSNRITVKIKRNDRNGSMQRKKVKIVRNSKSRNKMLTSKDLVRWAIERQKKELKMFPELAKKSESRMATELFLNIDESPNLNTRRSKRVVSTELLRDKMNSLEVKLGVNNAIWSIAVKETQRLKDLLNKNIDVMDFTEIADYLPILPVKNVMELRLLDRALELDPKGEMLLRVMFQETYFTNTPLFGFLITNLEKLMAPECTKFCSWSGLMRTAETSNAFELRQSKSMEILCREIFFVV